ncbi:MAG: sugar phosphate isomerase/epimerase [Planctomycetes bacterium]|nr:sugar phosphate isomerase/epimerase [Planctomycetota bacterium]
MSTIKAPAIFLAQFMGDEHPFDNIDNVAKWAHGLGYKAVQIPSWDGRCIDLKAVAESKTYADEYKGKLQDAGIEIADLTSHIQGQLVAVNPAYDDLFDPFVPESLQGNAKGRSEWATDQLKLCAKASANLGLKSHGSFSGSFLWHTVYPWPQRPAGLVEAGFKKLADCWKPILDVFDENDVDLCYEIHPGEDLHDGLTFERFLAAVDNHSRANILYDPSHFVLQHMDYLKFIDYYHDRIKMVHIKDAELRFEGKSGVYGGYESWQNRPGRFRSLGDGQVDFKGIFSKLTQYGFDNWAVLEWECCLKHPEQGAAEGAKFINDHVIKVAEKAFDDFASVGADDALNAKLIGG